MRKMTENPSETFKFHPSRSLMNELSSSHISETAGKGKIKPKTIKEWTEKKYYEDNSTSSLMKKAQEVASAAQLVNNQFSSQMLQLN
jgi:hypothetical protein